MVIDMKKMLLFFLLISSVAAKCQKFTDLKMRRVFAQAMEFALIEATAYRGRYTFVPDTTVHHNIQGSFPIHDGNHYKLVYWKDSAAPVACGTVIFNRDVSSTSAVVDTALRPLKPEEARIIKMYQKVIKDVKNDKTILAIDNAHILGIPINTAWGRKFYIVWRPNDWRSLLFGNDYEYTFNTRDEIVSRIKMHKKVYLYHMESLDSTRMEKPLYGAGFHEHGKEETLGALIADIGGMIYNNIFFRWKSFVLSDKDNVYVTDMGTLQLHQYTHRQFKKSKTAVSIRDDEDK